MGREGLIRYDTGMDLIITEYEEFFDGIREVKIRIKTLYDKINLKLENPEEELKSNLNQMDLCTVHTQFHKTLTTKLSFKNILKHKL